MVKREIFYTHGPAASRPTPPKPGVQQVIVVNHPLIEHKLGIARDEKTSSSEFYRLIEEITKFEVYEATGNLKTEEIEVKTPIAQASVRRLSGKKLVFMPIWRAGDVMMHGARDVVPSGKVGFLGMFRDEETCEPQPYYCKLPKDGNERAAFVMDVMLATGGSAVAAIDRVKIAGYEDIRMINIVCVTEGLDKMAKHHPDVPIYTCAIDTCLDANNYIIPGLGDAGDRLYGTK